MKRTLVLVACLALIAVGAQVALRRARAAETSALAEGTFAALGGVRSLVSEVIWFRADRLQEEGRYVELQLLATTLTAMEPHTPEIWSYAAWNLAYNISAMMPTPEDRWRWVLAGISLLRDKGLKLNPGDPELCRELAWLFELKIAADVDSSAGAYRDLWRAHVEDVRARGAWSELGMDEAKKNAIERATGLDDWTDAALSAVYWASEGLAKAKGVDRARLLSIIRQSTILYQRRKAASGIQPEA